MHSVIYMQIIRPATFTPRRVRLDHTELSIHLYALQLPANCSRKLSIMGLLYAWICRILIRLWGFRLPKLWIEPFVNAFLKSIRAFGVPRTLRSDGGSESTSNESHRCWAMVVPYDPQANSLAERPMKEIMVHLRDLGFEKRINWAIISHMFNEWWTMKLDLLGPYQLSRH